MQLQCLDLPQRVSASFPSFRLESKASSITLGHAGALCLKSLLILCHLLVSLIAFLPDLPLLFLVAPRYSQPCLRKHSAALVQSMYT